MARYLDEDQEEGLKAPLYAYLRDKAKRRGGVTNSKTYDKVQEELVRQKANYDLGALVGGFSEAASMAGTLGGKRAQSDIIPRFNQAQYESSQGLYDNLLKMRNSEETANMNDLRVADYLTGMDQFDENKKAKKEEREIQRQHYANEREYRNAMLQAQLKDKAAARGLDERRLGIDEGRAAETVRRNKAMEGLYGKGRGPGAGPNWSAAATGEEGILYVNPKDPTQTKTVPLPKNFKAKGSSNPADKPPTESERKAGLQADVARKELVELERLEQGYDPGVRDAFANSIGGPLGNYARSDKNRAYEAAAQRILDPMLRAMSGANAPQAEIDAKRQGYIIQPGDDAGTITRKKAARREFIESLIKSAGRGAQGSELAPPPGDRVKVIDPNGKPGTIPADKLQDALSKGYRKAQ